MTLVLVNGGEVIVVNATTTKTAGQNLVLGLYKSNTVLAEATVIADLTLADFTGYSAETLTAANWTTTAGAPTNTTYPEVTFTSSAGSQSQAVYGYYLTQITSGLLVWAETFTDGPYTITNNGDTIKITLNFTMA